MIIAHYFAGEKLTHPTSRGAQLVCGTCRWWRWRKPKLRFVHLLRKSSYSYVRLALLTHTARHGLSRFRLPLTILYAKRKRTTKGAFLLLVEMAVIETASENLFPRLSTSVVYRLKFPFLTADIRADKIGSSLIHDRLQSAHLFTFTAKWRFLLSRSYLREALPLFKQQVKLYYLCRLFLNLKLLLWCLATARLPRFKVPVEILSSPYLDYYCNTFYAFYKRKFQENHNTFDCKIKFLIKTYFLQLKFVSACP